MTLTAHDIAADERLEQLDPEDRAFIRLVEETPVADVSAEDRARYEALMGWGE